MNENGVYYKSKLLKNKNVIIKEKDPKYSIFITLLSKNYYNPLYRNIYIKKTILILNRKIKKKSIQIAKLEKPKNIELKNKNRKNKIN